MAEADQQAAPVGALDARFLGKLAGEHVLTLEFAEPLSGTGGMPLLVADGWVEFPYSQTAFAAWQAGRAFAAPTLEARDAQGQWQVVLEKFGYPGRHAAPDVRTAARSARGHEGLAHPDESGDLLGSAWRWSGRKLVRKPSDPPCGSPWPSCASAASCRELSFPSSDQTFDYDQRLPLADVRIPAGYYSQFGSVEELVARADNALAIFGPGEEIHFEFAGLPPAPPGWTRRFVLETVGWCKDMDLYTQNGATVEPLPQAGPLDGRRDRLHQQYNTRYQQGRLLAR